MMSARYSSWDTGARSIWIVLGGLVSWVYTHIDGAMLWSFVVWRLTTDTSTWLHRWLRIEMSVTWGVVSHCQTPCRIDCPCQQAAELRNAPKGTGVYAHMEGLYLEGVLEDWDPRIWGLHDWEDVVGSRTCHACLAQARVVPFFRHWLHVAPYCCLYRFTGTADCFSCCQCQGWDWRRLTQNDTLGKCPYTFLFVVRTQHSAYHRQRYAGRQVKLAIDSFSTATWPYIAGLRSFSILDCCNPAQRLVPELWRRRAALRAPTTKSMLWRTQRYWSRSLLWCTIILLADSMNGLKNSRYDMAVNIRTICCWCISENHMFAPMAYSVHLVWNPPTKISGWSTLNISDHPGFHSGIINSWHKMPLWLAAMVHQLWHLVQLQIT